MTASERRTWDGVERRRPPIVHLGQRMLLGGRSWWVRGIRQDPDGRSATVELHIEEDG